MALTTSTSVTNAILAKHIEAMIRESLQATLVMPQLVTQADLRGKGSKVWATNQWQSLTAAGVAENADITATEVQLDQATITVSEVGISVDITDISVETSGISPQQYAQRGTIAVKQKMESDLCALFSGFSSTVGSTGTDFTLDTLIEAIETIETNNVEGPIFGVLHPRQVATWRKLIAGASGSQASYFSNGTVDPSLKSIPGFVGDFLGVPFYRSTHVPKINTNTDYCGAIFAAGALGMATLRDVRVEPDRDASARSTEMVVTSAYGVGEINDSMGVGLVSVVA